MFLLYFIAFIIVVNLPENFDYRWYKNAIKNNKDAYYFQIWNMLGIVN